jgi:hypothetical protein
MQDQLRVRTNYVPRDVIDAFELSAAERAEFDYIDWPGVDAGTASGSFFRYRGELYDLGEFDTTSRLPRFSPLACWDGYQADSFFSAVVVRYCDDHERVVVGLALS